MVVSMASGLLLAYLTNSSIIFALAITLPFIAACLSVGGPVWLGNGCQFFAPRKVQMEGQLWSLGGLAVTKKVSVGSLFLFRSLVPFCSSLVRQILRPVFEEYLV